MAFSPLTKLKEYVTQLSRFKIKSFKKQAFGARTLVLITYGDNDEGIATADVTGIDEKVVDDHIMVLLKT